MLDLKTVLVVALATASLQAVAWIFVWQAWRHLYELRFLAAGFGAIALGLLLMIIRGPEPSALAIVVHNTVIKLGLVLLAEGLARFLGQPRYTWVGVSLLLCQITIWSAALAIDTDNIAIRIYSSTLFTIIMMSVMCLGLLRDRTQPMLLRWITIGLLVEYMAASILQSVTEYRLSADFNGGPILADRNAWYLLQGTLFLIAFFACLLFMVSARLSDDLRRNHDALLREVEERRRLESKLSASLETERALRDEQAAFMRVVSHEFRTPLAIIRNAADMIGLVGETSPGATRERLAGIGEALNRLFSLIDRFMADDRENGFQPEPMQLGSLIGDVRLHFELTERGDRLHFSLTDEAVSLYADPDMLGTVVINLIDNALKYAPDDPSIRIKAWEEEGSVVIQVSDRGIGIPSAELGKIGRRFFRASNAKASTGTGLGLYAARKFLVYHGGTLQLVSNCRTGTTAIARVPSSCEARSPDLQKETTT